MAGEGVSGINADQRRIFDEARRRADLQLGGQLASRQQVQPSILANAPPTVAQSTSLSLPANPGLVNPAPPTTDASFGSTIDRLLPGNTINSSIDQTQTFGADLVNFLDANFPSPQQRAQQQSLEQARASAQSLVGGATAPQGTPSIAPPTLLADPLQLANTQAPFVQPTVIENALQTLQTPPASGQFINPPLATGQQLADNPFNQQLAALRGQQLLQGGVPATQEQVGGLSALQQRPSTNGQAFVNRGPSFVDRLAAVQAQQPQVNVPGQRADAATQRLNSLVDLARARAQRAELFGDDSFGNGDALRREAATLLQLAGVQQAALNPAIQGANQFDTAALQGQNQLSLQNLQGQTQADIAATNADASVQQSQLALQQQQLEAQAVLRRQELQNQGLLNIANLEQQGLGVRSQNELNAQTNIAQLRLLGEQARSGNPDAKNEGLLNLSKAIQNIEPLDQALGADGLLDPLRVEEIKQRRTELLRSILQTRQPAQPQ